MINIALIDDHDLFREGIKLVLNQIEGFDVIFDASDGKEFLRFLENTVPDIVLMDISMPGISGVETTESALRLHPGLKVIALTMFSDTLHYTRMIDAGAKGFLLKKSNKFELQQAITAVFNGGNYFSQEILQKLAFHAKHIPESEEISPREMDVLNLVCKGFTSQEISEKLFISVKTVETHRGNIFRKTEVRNAAELINWAVKNTIFTIE
jgi:DNA-binding NarL/FixJ family response regulator